MSRQVVVLGMHRTGTSMVSAMLQLMGVSMGSQEGHFEDADFVTLNIAILHAAGADTFEMVPQETIDSVTDFQEPMAALVAQRNAAFELWGFKDPRTLLTLSHWLRVLDDPLLILTARAQEAILQSLARRTRPTRTKTLETIRRYASLTEELLLRTNKLLVVPYASVLQDPEGSVRNLCEFIAVPMCTEAVAYVDPRKDHYADEA